MNHTHSTGRWAALALVAALAACGGDDSDNTEAHRQAVERALAKEAEARSLATDTPCAGVAQCGTLNFLAPAARCPDWTYRAYSTAAPSAAAASAAAAEQNRLAAQAQALGSTGAVCPAVVTPPPSLACNANRCTATP